MACVPNIFHVILQNNFFLWNNSGVTANSGYTHTSDRFTLTSQRVNDLSYFQMNQESRQLIWTHILLLI